MSERSVAEIIGWELGHEKRYPFDDETWHFSTERDVVGDRVIRLGYPTVDDLLTWLRGQIASESEPGDGDAIEMWWDPEHQDMLSVTISYETWDAPTLLAALEAAVRAVAGES